MRNLVAADVMQRNVITLSPSLTIQEAARVFREHRITGAPVVDDDNQVCGVVSQTDLLREISEQEQDPAVGFYLAFPYSDGSIITKIGDLPDPISIASVMRTEILMVAPDEPLASVASKMQGNRVHRVLVTEGAKLLGIVSTFDILSVVAEH